MEPGSRHCGIDQGLYDIEEHDLFERVIGRLAFSTNELVAVVLAGGFGRRVRKLLPNLPKPMAPVLSRPFLEWVVRFLSAQGVRRILISTGHLGEVIEQHFRTQPVKVARVRCVRETAPLGTAGGFLHAAALSEEKPAAWLVMNGDSLALASLAGLIQALNSPSFEGVLLGVSLENAARFGTLVLGPDNVLQGFQEKKPGTGVINAGVYLLRSGLVEKLPEQRPLSFEKEVFPRLIETNVRLKVVVADSPFLDIGTPESLPMAESFIQANRDWFAAE
ncbi:MAG: NTP transferase domain-containing protein [Verrucomicrobia bacterium]|nr:NTP transferase domain-containing protein [Verrucomicrobiota bacterium]